MSLSSGWARTTSSQCGQPLASERPVHPSLTDTNHLRAANHAQAAGSTVCSVVFSGGSSVPVYMVMPTQGVGEAASSSSFATVSSETRRK